MSTRAKDSLKPYADNNYADQVWLDYIGEGYSQAMRRRSNNYAPTDYLKLRRGRLLALGLDPENIAHWQIETETLSELERIALSMKATGFPDTNRLEADVALANQELMLWLQSLSGQ